MLMLQVLLQMYQFRSFVASVNHPLTATILMMCCRNALNFVTEELKNPYV